MLRLHGVVSICLSLVVFGASGAVAQERSTGSRLLRSVLPEKIDAAAKEPTSASGPARNQPAAPTRRIETNARSTAPNRAGTGANADRNPLRSNPVRSAARPRPRSSPRTIAAILAALAAEAPFDLSSSGRFLVAAQRGGAGLVLVDVPGRRRLRQLENSNRRYALVAISPDARWIAAVVRNDNERIDLWRADNGRRVAVLKAPGGEKQKLEFSARANELRVTSRGGVGLVFSVPAGKVIGRFGAPSGAAVKEFRMQAPQPAPRIGAAPKGEDSKGEIRRAPVVVTPRQEPSPERDVVSSPTPREAAAAPTLAKPPVVPDVQIPSEPRTATKAAPKITASRKVAPKKAAKKFASPGAAPEPRMAAPEPRMAAPEPSMAVPEPRMAAPEPRMAAPVPRAMMREPDEGGAEQPPAGAAPPGIFDNITGTLPETAAESAGDAAAEPALPGPAAPGDSSFAERAESAPEAAAETAAPPADEDISSITVHFATNRNRLAPKDREWLVYFRGFFSTLPAFVIYALVILSLLIFPWFGKRSWAAYAVFTGAVVLCAMGTLEAYVRSQLRDELSGELFGSRPVQLSYGACEVSVPLPENRQTGELNRPVSVWVFEAPENPEKHFMLRKVTEHADLDAFHRSLSAELDKTSTRAALLFIHGYNVSFEDAVFRTAQLAVDLKFPGAPITFSWPSYADPVKYTFDEQNAEVSIPAFHEFLKDLAAKCGVERIHVIAHSMGNRVLAGALERMDRESQEINRKVIREIVLAAPDIDRRVFESQVLPHVAENTQHCTLYASSRDRALLISHYFHNYQRLGETEPELIVANGMDTIDASLVDTSLLGHSYIGDVQSIVSDLHDLVVGGKPPMERLGLESLRRGELTYWTIRPQLETATDPSLRR